MGELSASFDAVQHIEGPAAQASRRQANKLEQVRADLAAYGAPWEDSKDGKTFDDRCAPQRGWAMDSMNAKVDLLKAYGDTFQATVRDFRTGGSE